MKVHILSGVCLGKGIDALPGEGHTVTDREGRALISRGKARERTDADEKKPKEPAK